LYVKKSSGSFCKPEYASGVVFFRQRGAAATYGQGNYEQGHFFHQDKIEPATPEHYTNSTRFR